MADGTNGASGDDKNPGMKGIVRPLALASQLGVTMGLMTVATVLGSLLLGSWVDRQLGTRPLATLIFVLAGVFAGLLGTVHLARSTLRDLDAAAARKEEPRTAFSGRDLGRALLLVAQLAAVTLVPIGLGLGLGLWVDQATGSRPIFTIALALVGATIAMAAVFFVTGRASRRAGPNP